MTKKQMIKELMILEDYAKRCDDYSISKGIMFSIGWLKSAYGLLENYERIADTVQDKLYNEVLNEIRS